MFELTFLGTAATTPSSERGLPALLVGAGGERFLIDCGEGTQRQLLRAGTGFRRLGHILLTHAHLAPALGLGGLPPPPRPFAGGHPPARRARPAPMRFAPPYLAPPSAPARPPSISRLPVFR